MRCATCVRIFYDKTTAAGWSVRSGASGAWAEIAVFPGDPPEAEKIVALVRAGRAALAAVHPALDLRWVASLGAWAPPPAAAADVEAAVFAAWGVEETELVRGGPESPPDRAAEGAGRSAPEAACDGLRPAPPGWAPAEEKKAAPRDGAGASGPAEEKGAAPQSGAGAAGAEAGERGAVPQAKPEKLGQSVLLTGRRRRGGRNSRKRTPISLTEGEFVDEICKIVRSHINLHGSAPNFADERSKLSALNYIRSTSGQQEISAEVLEAVRGRLAAEA
jgi:hypothetical protein